MDTKNSIIFSFENSILNNLINCGCDINVLAENNIRLGAAISGGADSISLLTALSSFSLKTGLKLSVITVNHNIRTIKESQDDINFVIKYCEILKKRGIDINYTVCTLEKGFVQKISLERRKGIEEAARFLRYNIFSQQKNLQNLPFICLAHNENDQLETLLMRFLQGNGNVSSGIKPVRDFYLRPMLNISREKIEEYLKIQNISWCTDNTNFDESYLRNKIRQRLIPELDLLFAGWKKAVLMGAQKADDDESAFKSAAACFQWNKSKSSEVFMQKDIFLKTSKAIQRRLFYEAFSLLGVEQRIPYRLIQDVFLCIEKKYDSFLRKSCGIEITLDGNLIYVKKEKINIYETLFFAVINKSGIYKFPFGNVNVKITDKSAELLFSGEKDNFFIKDIPVPFVIRSKQPDDYIEMNNGKLKSVSDVLSDFKVTDKNLIPLIQELADNKERIMCIIGSICGFKNWIVRG